MIGNGYPFGETVTLLATSVSGADALGNDILTTTPTVYTNVPVWPIGDSEDTAGRDQVVATHAALLPSGSPVKAQDRIQWQGNTFEIDGEPNEHTNPITGSSAGVLVTIKLVTG